MISLSILRTQVLRTMSCSVKQRPMSMWPASFEDPIPHKDQIAQAKESGEYKKRLLVPVKAADKEATCSKLLDEEFLAFLRTMQKDGKKHIVMESLKKTFEKIKEIQLKKYYKASEENKEEIITDPSEVLYTAVHKARPLMAIHKVKIGSVVYQVPAPITMHRSLFEARRWILNAARDRDRTKTNIHDVLANVIVDTANESGRVIAQRNEHHKTCEQNRAYAHYRISK